VKLCDMEALAVIGVVASFSQLLNSTISTAKGTPLSGRIRIK